MNTRLARLMIYGVLCGADVVCAADKLSEVAEQKEDGSIKLSAGGAKIAGPNARWEGGDVKGILWWTNVDTSLQWTAHILKPGRYRVELSYAVVGNNNGSPLEIVVGDQALKAIPKAGNDVSDFKTGQAGEVTISKPGNFQVAIKPLEASHEYVLALRNISLHPTGTPTEAIDISGTAIRQSEDDSFTLSAGDARISGINAQLQTDGGKNIGFWSDVETSLIWSINVDKPGNYRVELNYSLVDSYEGSKVAIAVDDRTVKAKPKPTKTWTDYQTGNVGEITIGKSGAVPVVVTPMSNPGGFVMNLHSITLRPAGTPAEAIDISDKPVAQAVDGSLNLTANDAEIDGQSGRLEGDEQKYIAWWNNPERCIRWPVKIDKAGDFDIQLTYALATSTSTRQVQVDGEGQKITATLPPTPSNRSKVSLTVAGHTVLATLNAGSGWDDFKTEKVGEVTLPEEGNLEVVLKSLEPLGTPVMHLRSVTFVPKAGE